MAAPEHSHPGEEIVYDIEGVLAYWSRARRMISEPAPVAEVILTAAAAVDRMAAAEGR